MNRPVRTIKDQWESVEKILEARTSANAAMLNSMKLGFYWGIASMERTQNNLGELSDIDAERWRAAWDTEIERFEAFARGDANHPEFMPRKP